MEYVAVRDVAVPAVGLGTWQTTGEECYETVSTALELGYRHVDTARAMAELREDGLVRHLGVSNFRRWRLRRARETSPAAVTSAGVGRSPRRSARCRRRT